MAQSQRRSETLFYNLARALAYLGFMVIAAAAAFIGIMVIGHG
jgi:hypothetical protein